MGAKIEDLSPHAFIRQAINYNERRGIIHHVLHDGEKIFPTVAIRQRSFADDRSNGQCLKQQARFCECCYRM
jgi:hypothetical protein